MPSKPSVDVTIAAATRAMPPKVMILQIVLAWGMAGLYMGSQGCGCWGAVQRTVKSEKQIPRGNDRKKSKCKSKGKGTGRRRQEQ